MRKALKLELEKAFTSPLFVFSLLVGVAFIVASAWEVIPYFYGESGALAFAEEVYNKGLIYEVEPDAVTLYNSWIGGGWADINIMFFYILPLLSMLPCGFSLSNEIRSKYVKHIIPRCGRKNYILAKYISAFIVGASIVATLLILNVLIVALFLPAIPPRVMYNYFYPVMHGNILSSMAYQKPLLFIFCYIGIDAVFGGLFACLPLSAAFVFEKPLAAVIVPYLFVLICDTLRNFLLYINYIEISPLLLMHAVSIANESRWHVVLIWYGVFAFLGIPYGIYRGLKYEIV